MDNKEKKIIKTTTQELFKLLDIDGVFDILEKENGENIDIILDTPDTGIVIGYHGDRLEALQLVLSLCVSKKLGKFKHISIEVGDYKKNRTDWLRNLALTTKEKVISENKELVLPQLKSWERRIIHLMFEGDKEVVSESQGEGRDRVLVIRPR